MQGLSTVVKALVGNRTLLLAAEFLLLSLSVACSDKKAGFTELASDKEITQILEDAEFAITERNFRINNRLHIGKALRTRGSSGFPDYEVILFCNLSYAKKMLEQAPDFIRYCPHRLAVRDNGDNRIITASLLPQETDNQALNAVTTDINARVIEIVEFAAQDWPKLDE